MIKFSLNVTREDFKSIYLILKISFVDSLLDCLVTNVLFNQMFCQPVFSGSLNNI